MEEEKVFTIPLGEARKTRRKKRAQKAVKIIKEFIKKNLNVGEVRVSSDLNQKIWERGAEKPPRRVRAKAIKTSEGVAEVSHLE